MTDIPEGRFLCTTIGPRILWIVACLLQSLRWGYTTYDYLFPKPVDAELSGEVLDLREVRWRE